MKTNISALMNLISEEERCINSRIYIIKDLSINTTVEELDGRVNVIEDNKETFDLELKELEKNISRLSQTSKTYSFDEKAIESIEKETNINFSNEQKKSFDSLKTSGIKIITGGPGCGKTTTIDGLIHYIKEVYKEDVRTDRLSCRWSVCYGKKEY